jgi:hypothetical protein
MSSKRAPSKARPSDAEFWRVESDLPDPLPVGKAEIDAIERYFSGLLEAVLESKPRAVPADTLPHRKGEKR